jgi:hypothetical protein
LSCRSSAALDWRPTVPPSLHAAVERGRAQEAVTTIATRRAARPWDRRSRHAARVSMPPLR